MNNHPDQRVPQNRILATHRLSISIQRLIMGLVWMVPLCVGLRASLVISAPNDVMHIYVWPLVCTAAMVSVQLVFLRHSHQWAFVPSLCIGALAGVACLIMLWGPIFLHDLGRMNWATPRSPSWKFPGPAVVVIPTYGLVTGASIGSVWFLIAGASRRSGPMMTKVPATFALVANVVVIPSSLLFGLLLFSAGEHLLVGLSLVYVAATGMAVLWVVGGSTTRHGEAMRSITYLANIGLLFIGCVVWWLATHDGRPWNNPPIGSFIAVLLASLNLTAVFREKK